MITISFLGEWALRSALLIAAGGLLLRLLRVKDASVRLAAWTAMLCGSLALPLLTVTLPKAPVTVWREAVTAAPVIRSVAQALPAAVTVISAAPVSRARPFDWKIAILAVYLTVAGLLLLRLCAGLVMSLRLLRQSKATGLTTDGIEIRESCQVASPVTLGIVRSAIVLPACWRQWDCGKLDAVLAHERSHVGRRDPAMQFLSAIHRALVWHSPLSWYLHRRMVQVAEEASDDAALAGTMDRVSYAELLLEFMRRGAGDRRLQGVAMARYGRVDARIDRILDGTTLSRGVTRLAVTVILVAGAPLAYLAAAAHPESQTLAAMEAEQVPPAPPVAPLPPQPPAPAAPPVAPAPPAEAPAPPQVDGIRRHLIVLDNSMSGSWDSEDRLDQDKLRQQFGKRFAWFRQNGNEYVVTDAGVMKDLEQAMEPQKKVNALQAEVNANQSRVNGMQEKVNSLQGGVNGLQQQVNQMQAIINRIQAASARQDQQAMIQELERALAELRAAKSGVNQEAVNGKQAGVNIQQELVNAEQRLTNKRQEAVNAEQRRASAEMNGKIEGILDSAVKRHLAQRYM